MFSAAVPAPPRGVIVPSTGLLSPRIVAPTNATAIQLPTTPTPYVPAPPAARAPGAPGACAADGVVPGGSVPAAPDAPAAGNDATVRELSTVVLALNEEVKKLSKSVAEIRANLPPHPATH